MEFIKTVLKHTFMYKIIKYFRAWRAAREWTSHDQKMLDFYSQFLSSGDLCFDVGANVGNRTKIFLRLGAKVVAVEPQDQCVKHLREFYGSNRRLTIIQKALGESEGEAEIMISNANTISSLSQEWIKSVKQSGRFAKYSWDKKQVVSMTTLDRLIEQYGTPTFVKIDVEGFEYQVIKGLSQPLKALSLEFTPEFIESTFKCIDYLQQLGDIRLNYSVGETMQLALAEWVNPQEMVRILSSFRGDNKLFGDVYVQFIVQNDR